jgi:DNA-binding NarL/FixJ family response regulator
MAQRAGALGAQSDYPATVSTAPGPPVEAGSMTKREREVVELIAEGLSNKEMAERLHIALHTVKSHMHSVLEKLRLDSRLQVAAYVHGDRQCREARSRPSSTDNAAGGGSSSRKSGSCSAEERG